MNVYKLLWLEAVKNRLWQRNPLRLMVRQIWFTLTEIPLMWSARKELAQALDAEYYRQRDLTQKLTTIPIKTDRHI